MGSVQVSARRLTASLALAAVAGLLASCPATLQAADDAAAATSAVAAALERARENRPQIEQACKRLRPTSAPASSS